MHALLLSIGSALAPLQDATRLETSIRDVAVFPSSALVRRAGEIAVEAGRFVVSGLPAALDANTVRARCEGAKIVGLEVRQRFQPSAPGARLEAARARLRTAERAVAGLKDERAVLEQLAAHLERALALEGGGETKLATTANAGAWKWNLEWLAGDLAAQRAALRDNAARIEEAERALRDAQLELGECDPSNGVTLHDVLVDVAGGAGRAELEIEYVVSSAGWQPLYDLRAARDARSVTLGYRARVWQQTGEDWNEVEVALSTARPQSGAQGPEPEPSWVYLHDPRAPARGAASAPPPGAEMKSLGYADVAKDEAELEAAEPAAAPRPFAAVESQGLSVRFRLAQRETLPSRAEPSNVLIGEARLVSRPEYHATPSLDTNVWLRGIAVNTSEWTLLPGRASVYFGADFIGHSAIEAVQPGEELTLHLGPDPALSLERILVKQKSADSGLFGGRTSKTDAFVIRIENHGAAAGAADGSATVYVREALPRPRDDRISVDLAQAEPKPSEDARWKRDREEQGIATWVLRAPRGGEAKLEYGLRISYPDGALVVER
jgi:uncharacterized protein (TIGR02231 family)